MIAERRWYVVVGSLNPGKPTLKYLFFTYVTPIGDSIGEADQFTTRNP